MASPFDRYRAAGRYSNVMPAHKPDPRDPSVEYQDERFAQPDPQFSATLDQMDRGSAYQPPVVMGAQPQRPGVGPSPTMSDRLQAISQGTQRGRQFAAGDVPMRQQLAQGEMQHAKMMAKAQDAAKQYGQGDPGKSQLFLAALQMLLGGSPSQQQPPTQAPPPPAIGLSRYR